jgi:hypothetical protein
MYIKPDLIELFRHDLCKDQRLLEVLPMEISACEKGCKILRKHSTNLAEHKNEFSAMEFLRNNGITGIPHFLNCEQESVDYVDVEYFEGIRVFNMLAYFREYGKIGDSEFLKARKLREYLLARCLERQKDIQKKLIMWAKTQGARKPYPQQKLKNIVRLITDIMKLPIKKSVVYAELAYIRDKFALIADTPFRDATTKNMILHVPEIHLGRYFVAEKDTDVLAANARRQQFIFSAIKSGEIQKCIDAPLIDFDFSSCEHNTTIFDDAIGFICHEISWNGIPKMSELCWEASRVLNGEDVAISFIIRFLRFGGRKLSYHIIHPEAYKFRFHYDNEFFYFSNLNKLLDVFWPDSKSQIPELRKFIDLVNTANSDDFIDDVDEFHETTKICDRKFYIDIFPF